MDPEHTEELESLKIIFPVCGHTLPFRARNSQSPFTEVTSACDGAGHSHALLLGI